VEAEVVTEEVAAEEAAAEETTAEEAEKAERLPGPACAPRESEAFFCRRRFPDGPQAVIAVFGRALLDSSG